MQSHASPLDRQLIIVIDIHESCSGLIPKTTAGPTGTASGTIPHCHFEADSQQLRDNDALTQQLIGCVYREFHRVNQEVTVNRHIDLFKQRLQSLSPRELDVLVLTVQGRTCKEMAGKLAVGIATVAKHRAKLFKKLGIRNCIELMHLLSSLFSEQSLGSESS